MQNSALIQIEILSTVLHADEQVGLENNRGNDEHVNQVKCKGMDKTVYKDKTS